MHYVRFRLAVQTQRSNHFRSHQPPTPTPSFHHRHHTTRPTWRSCPTTTSTTPLPLTPRWCCSAFRY